MNFEKERNEALAAGRTALRSLEEARDMLSGAKGWGIFDTFFGGGLISGLMKHSKMDQAEARLEQAGEDLQRFSDELDDLNLQAIDLQTDDLLGFADIFFDGLLTDLLMQSRINDATRKVDQAIDRVEDILYRLERM